MPNLATASGAAAGTRAAGGSGLRRAASLARLPARRISEDAGDRFLPPGVTRRVGARLVLDRRRAARADYVHIPYRDSLDAGNDGTNTYNRVSPEIGVTYRFTDDIKAFAGYKSGFRAPAPLELACASPTAPCSLPFSLGNDPRLEPVTTQDYEGGFDVDVTSRTSLDVDAFWTDVYNDIVFASPNLTQEYFLNAPHTRRAGVEASAQVGLPEGFRLVGSYSYVAATYQSAVLIATSDSNPQPTKPGDLFPLSPLHRGRVGAGVTHLFGALILDGEFAIRGYQGQFLRGDESNQRKEVPGYTVAGLTARADYHRFGAELAIENLFNRQYYTFGIESQNFLGPYNQNTPPANPIVEPFYTPGYARRITVTLSTRP
jgi:outer membrane receptor protein involved in Fe transport